MARVTVRSISDQIIALRRRQVEMMTKQFPCGSLVWWRHGENTRRGIVVEHSQRHPQLKVRGATGKEYWIEATYCE